MRAFSLYSSKYKVPSSPPIAFFESSSATELYSLKIWQILISPKEAISDLILSHYCSRDHTRNFDNLFSQFTTNFESPRTWIDEIGQFLKQIVGVPKEPIIQLSSLCPIHNSSTVQIMIIINL